ncbi:uncharacterized protein JCM15063_001893 [Sporobolomyces koalae]|uniref:uncharacterized protein n=1 Tax=Sporobolomyces koalae TaxID=500713 RepID=UPI0031727667
MSGTTHDQVAEADVCWSVQMDLARSSSASLETKAPDVAASPAILASHFRLDPLCLEQASSLRQPSKLGQDTLAARRLLKAAKAGRPPIVRRRSRSLDDEARVNPPPATEPFRIDPTPYLDTRSSRTSMTTSTPFSASSFSSNCTTIPNSAISSSCATTAPSPYIACPMTPCLSFEHFSPGGFVVPPPITRSFSDTALELTSNTTEPLFSLPVSELPQSQSSKSLSKSFSAADHRLASWIKVTSSPFSGTPHALPPLAESPAPSCHQSVRHQFTPVLPSPLSESYTSVGEDGFPFPATPVLPSFPAHPDSVIASTSSASAPTSPESSVRSAPVVSPMIPRAHARAHTFASTTTSAPITRSPPFRSTTLPSPAAGVPLRTFERQERRSIPLTPPDSICTAPFLATASASELAWQDVLGSRMEANKIPAVAQAQISLMDAEGRGKGKDAPRFSSSTPDEEAVARKSRGANGNELMSTVGGGHFGTATRERLSQLIQEHLGDVPLKVDDSIVQIVEYGAIHSKSSALVHPILSHFALRHRSLIELSESTTLQPTTFDEHEEVSFSVLHTDKTGSDFRNLAQSLDASASPSESYLQVDPTLDGRVFSTFSARPFGSKVVPKGSVSVGFSAMSLHWPSTDRKYRVAPATLAHGELMAFLSARAFEFKAGGLLTLAYIGRSEEYANAGSPGYSPYSSSPSTPSASPTEASTIMTRTSSGRSASMPVGIGAGAVPTSRASVPALPTRKRDIWAVLTSVLGKAIQRLVSTGLLKPQVARQLLALPLHPRTPRQTLACVRASSHSWELLHSSLLTLAHPAWQGVTHGTVSPESWADYTIQLLKIFWEAEIRAILKDALGSRGACEWVLDCLWTVAKEKVEEDPPHPLELEIQLLALRRRSNRSSSTPPSPSMI